ncbi:hypothetical protein NUW54_g12879 [Trametes sanguinea]|uniref:Uncharacterized protein n=1 Tax=Trametes sanguinea TaxID=158606 RepID=A0ACC1MSJ4_9APHY|nr:hypothetical protein NUW54_g12879 [Trametes sanguinea]
MGGGSAYVFVWVTQLCSSFALGCPRSSRPPSFRSFVRSLRVRPGHAPGRVRRSNDIIVKPETKNAPTEFTSVPFPVKALKLLLHELQSGGESATMGFNSADLADLDSDDGVRRLELCARPSSGLLTRSRDLRGSHLPRECVASHASWRAGVFATLVVFERRKRRARGRTTDGADSDEDTPCPRAGAVVLLRRTKKIHCISLPAGLRRRQAEEALCCQGPRTDDREIWSDERRTGPG